MENKILEKFLKVKSSTVDDMKILLEDVKMCKNEKLETEIKKLQEELREVKKLKKYGLVWEEKIEKFDEETVGKLPVLEEIKKYDIKNDESESNILIEGDNYHTLSVLNYTHKGKIDVIYIDPPYNTGNKDFIYNDKIIDKEDKFRHSKWLSFMNKRLKLAKDLLSEKGVIFISIDDNEFAQLKLLCDEHFGIESFIGSFIWNKKLTGGYDNKFLNIQHEYIFIISKNKEFLNINYDEVESKYKEIDENGRKYKWDSLWNIGGLTYSKSLDYPITAPDGTEIWPFGEKGKAFWLWSKKKVENEIDKLKFDKDRKGNWKVYKRVYASGKVVPGSILNKDIVKGNTNSSREIKNIFEGEKIFDYSKPTTLVKYIISKGGNKNSTILDFFAGSGTTGHAVLELNKEDGGNRKFILATNNENNICEEVTYERVKRVMNGYKNLKGEEVEGLGGNLKYLKTDFIDKNNSNDDLRKRMVDRCSELLCLKENVWEPVLNPSTTKERAGVRSKIKIFKRNDKYLAILYDMFFVGEFKKILNNLEEKESISIYAFSHYKIDNDDFEELNMNYEIEKIPDPILEVYDSIFGL